MENPLLNDNNWPTIFKGKSVIAGQAIAKEVEGEFSDETDLPNM